MSMVAQPQRIASAYVVLFGPYGAVTEYAQQRGVCRQWIYREAAQLREAPNRQQQRLETLQTRVQQLEQDNAALAHRLAQAVVLDAAKQAQFASVGQAVGVSLPQCWQLLDVLIPGQQQSVPTLGRATQAAGKQAGKLLPILDAWARAQVREVAADEIYVKAPVLMTVEPESLCWLGGRLVTEANGAAWEAEFGQLPNLEQVTRDGGSALAKGVELVNSQRQEQGQPPIVDQGDHFHALRGGRLGLGRVAKQARQALAKAEAAQKEWAACNRQGHSLQAAGPRAHAAWRQAEQTMDTWSERAQVWKQTKAALQLFTPDGELNTRARAEAVLAETLPQLPDRDFAKTKRQLQQPEMLNYLDRVQDQIAALPFADALKQAAVRQEGLRRRPELLQGERRSAAACRGVLLVCAVLLSPAKGDGPQVVAAVRDILRRAYRASSLVECINSVLRMQQARHRKMTQSLLDLKRLYWNCHTFRTGRRRRTTPYQRLGVPWPEGLRWWDLLKLTPEQLQEKLSTAKTAA
jgi:hypothetical protein